MQKKQVVTKAEYISQNMEVFKTMVKAGMMPPSTLQYYKIFLFYSGLKNIKKKTERYGFAADTMGVSETTIRNAIAFMKEPVN